jgi:hypothetical protein
MNTVRAIQRSCGLVVLLLAAGCGEGGAQRCPSDLAVQTVELRGLTTDRGAERRQVDQLHLPPTQWQDSLWVQVTMTNRGQSPITAVSVYAGVRAVVGPVIYRREQGMRYPDHERSLAQGVPFPSPIFLQKQVQEFPPGDRTISLGPFSMRDVFPWLDQGPTWHALPVAVDVDVAAMVFQTPGGEECFDRPADNASSVRVPLLNLR